MADDINALIRDLDTDDQRRQRRAGDALLAVGPDAVLPLLHALEAESPQLRKAAAFLLGAARTFTPGVLAALGRAVAADPEPKVRKNAAVALGRSGSTDAVAALALALAQEPFAYVRPSLILAIGAIGGDAARAALLDITPQDAAEADALRKALDRSAPRHAAADWRDDGLAAISLLLDAPQGLEWVLREEAHEHGLGSLEQIGFGLLRVPADLAPWDLADLRCCYGLLVDAGAGPPLSDDPDFLAEDLVAMIARSAALSNIRYWLASDQPVIRYRFSLDFRLRRDDLRGVIDAVRAACAPFGLEDSPSNYDIELIAHTDERGSRLCIRPSFTGDTRFAYRQRDVGAAINPVLGACLARVVRTGPAASVFDPTCGSATLLIERALLDPQTSLVGLDISPTACAAATTNIVAAGFQARIAVSRGDAADPSTWPICDEVLANLPFGLRTAREDADLEALYRDLLGNLVKQLRSGGRALLYTSHRDLLQPLLEAHIDKLELRRRFRVRSGGLWVDAWLLEAR